MWPGVGGELRVRSRSPRRDAPQVPIGPTMVAVSSEAATTVGQTGEVTTRFDFPSPRLGQLLGFKGQTIQKIKQISGVQRLHIHDKEKAQRFHKQYQTTIPIEVVGTDEQIRTTQRLLEGVCLGDQTELGFLTTTLDIEPPMIGKIMGAKGQTIREMTEHTGCYIEIRQFIEQGIINDQPCLFFAGAPEAVEAAASLAQRFIDSPGANLNAVLTSQTHQAATIPTVALNSALPPLDPSPVSRSLHTAGLPLSTSGPALTAPVEPEGPLVERTIEVPARLKGHLLGLKGQTIDSIRKISGAIKCHMEERQDSSVTGLLHVNIMGANEKVEHCIKLINDVMNGDHSGLGHTTTYVKLDAAVVGKVMGAKGQTIKELTEVTQCYIEIQQDRGPWQGIVFEPQLFICGPPECVDHACDLIERFIQAPGSRLDAVLQPHERPAPPPSVRQPAALPQTSSSSSSHPSRGGWRAEEPKTQQQQQPLEGVLAALAVLAGGVSGSAGGSGGGSSSSRTPPPPPANHRDRGRIPTPPPPTSSGGGNTPQADLVSKLASTLQSANPAAVALLALALAQQSQKPSSPQQQPPLQSPAARSSRPPLTIQRPHQQHGNKW